MWQPRAPAVPPVNADKLNSPSEAVAPTMPISSPGAATQRMMPPKALNERLRRHPSVTLRCGLLVAALLNVTAGAARAAVAGSSAASLSVASAVSDPVATWLSRPKHMIVGEDAPA